MLITLTPHTDTERLQLITDVHNAMQRLYGSTSCTDEALDLLHERHEQLTAEFIKYEAAKGKSK